MNQQKEQQQSTMEAKLQQLKNKLPEGQIKESVKEKIKNFDKPIHK